MSTLSVVVEDIPKAYERLGGRGFTSTIVSKEVPQTSHPLGRFNKLLIAPGVLSGTNVANSGRLSVGCKSPLTGGIKESNVGGTSPSKLGRLRIAAIVIEGIPEKGGCYILRLSKEGGELIPGDEYRGLKNS